MTVVRRCCRPTVACRRASIGGCVRGRRQLRAPAGAPEPGLRPTSDRVREAIFDILASRGAVEGASVLDALRRLGRARDRGPVAWGRRRCASSRTTAGPSRRSGANLDSTGLADGARGPCRAGADVLEFLAREAGTRYDLALVDPPYSFDGLAVPARPSCTPTSPCSSRRLPSRCPRAFPVRREYRYGGTLVTLVEARGPGRDDPRGTEKDPV